MADRNFRNLEPEATKFPIGSKNCPTLFANEVSIKIDGSHSI